LNIQGVYKLIPFLASKFTPEHFIRLEINLFFKDCYTSFFIRDSKLVSSKAKTLQPKIIRITAEDVSLKTIKAISVAFDPSILSFDVIRGLKISHPNIYELKSLSNKAKMLEIKFDKDALDIMAALKYQPNLQSVTEYLIISTDGKY
jgi:hypothetical protein